MNDKELLAEAREWSSSYASWGDNGLVDRLADALSTRQPTEDDREALEEKFADYLGTEVYWCSRDYSAWSHGTMSIDDFSLAREDAEVLDSLVEIALSRAAVPDAANDEQVERIARILAQSSTFTEQDARVLVKAAQDIARAERDAALAAVERALTGLESLDLDGPMTRVGTAWGSILREAKVDLRAALDGAPEPGEEYRVMLKNGTELARGTLDEVRRFKTIDIERRRKAGPWLPVEGENKP